MTTSSASAASDTSQSTLRRGIDVLYALGSQEARAAGGLGVVRVAELLGLDKGQVSRTLRTLDGCGAVQRDPGSRLYRLGWRLVRLGTQATEQYVEDAAASALGALVDRWHEAAHLSVRQGREVRTVLSRVAERRVQALEPEGATAPADRTSAGRALLLDHPLGDLAALFGTSAGEVSGLADRLAEDRGRGYAVVADEWEVGLTSVAAPVREGGRIVAALNVSGPTGRMLPLTDRIGADLVAVAAAVGAALRTP